MVMDSRDEPLSDKVCATGSDSAPIQEGQKNG